MAIPPLEDDFSKKSKCRENDGFETEPVSFFCEYNSETKPWVNRITGFTSSQDIGDITVQKWCYLVYLLTYCCL